MALSGFLSNYLLTAVAFVGSSTGAVIGTTLGTLNSRIVRI